MWGGILRIDSSFSSRIDVSHISKYQGRSLENMADSVASDANPTIKDFKKALGKEDYERVIDSLKNLPTELTSTASSLKSMRTQRESWLRYTIRQMMSS